MHGTYIKMVNDVWGNSQYYDNHMKHAVRQNEKFHTVTAGGTCNCHCNLSGQKVVGVSFYEYNQSVNRNGLVLANYCETSL